MSRDQASTQIVRTKWLADFTYIWTAEDWLYVAVVLDLFSRRVAGWFMEAERDALLIMDALMMAVWRRSKGTPFSITRIRDCSTQANSFNGFLRATASLGR